MNVKVEKRLKVVVTITWRFYYTHCSLNTDISLGHALTLLIVSDLAGRHR